MPDTQNRVPNMVRIACKLPHGLWLELHDPPPPFDPARPFHTAMSFGAHITPRFRLQLNGANSVKDEFNSGLFLLSRQTLPYGVTNCPEDVWDQWSAKHKDHPFVTNGLIFALPKLKEVIAEAKVREPEKTGLEALNPKVENDPRLKEIQLPGQPETRVETDMDQLAKLQRHIDQGIA